MDKKVITHIFGHLLKKRLGSNYALQKARMYLYIQPLIILIKIRQCHYGVRTFLQNGSTDFDEILHVAWEWLPEGYATSGRPGYSFV